MSFTLIDHEGGVIHEVYSTRPGLSIIKDYTPDDEGDAQHDWQFAACSYMVGHGAMSPKLELSGNHGTRIWAPLERPDDTQTLLVREVHDTTSSPRRVLCRFCSLALQWSTATSLQSSCWILHAS